VSAGALGYWDLQHEDVTADPGKFIEDGKLWAAFVPRVYAIEIDYQRVDDLLIEAKKIWKSKVPPESREGCKNCKRLEALFRIQSAVEDELATRDKAMLQSSGRDAETVKRVVQQLYDRGSRRLNAYWELQEAGDDIYVEQDTMAGRWEFLL
jgi:hypothetical protein